MAIKKIILLLTGISFSTTTFSQNTIHVDILPTKISTDIKMIIPSGRHLIYERYHFFKHNYWLSLVDTLTKDDQNGILKGKYVTINISTYSKRVDKCDTTINKIRNSALEHKLFSELNDIARKEIGYDNQEFNSTINYEKPAVHVCHDSYRIVIATWFTAQTNKIDEIKSKKIKRLEEIKSNSGRVDGEYIKSFLNDYGACETDQLAIIGLITNHPDEFLSVCKELSDMSFFDIKLKLSILSDTIKTEEAISNLKASQIRTNRKKQLIKKLKKTR